MNEARQQFASDNYAGMCPEAWQALTEANQAAHALPYGEDPWTQRAKAMIQDLFATDCDVHFVFNGTAANSLVLAQLCQPYNAVICSALSHIATDECGAPEFFTGGSKLLPADASTPQAAHAKLMPADVVTLAKRRTDVHFPKARVVSMTQATEMGTVYTPDEVRAVATAAHAHELLVHMDGARFANAVASLGVAPADVTWKAGVDVLCFGGTKNGLAIGEAVVFFRRDLGRDFHYRIKQAAQLGSKARLLSAPWLGVLQDGAWLRHAAHANRMAAELEAALQSVPGITWLAPRQANSLFVRLPAGVISALHAQGWHFYEFLPPGGCRLMCAWDTEAETVRRFANAILAAMAAHA